MQSILLSILLVTQTTVFAANEPWKKVDKELSTGAKKMKDGTAFNKKSKKSGNSVKDKINSLWDSGLSNVGKALK